MSKYIEVENYCKNICRCAKDKCSKDECPLHTAPAADVMKIPCKINDVVYTARKYKGGWKVKKGIVNEMYFTNKMELVIVCHHINRGKWGKDIFPTEEAAQAAIKKVGADNG